MDQAESDNVEASYTCLLKIGVYIMSKLYECSECGELLPSMKLIGKVAMKAMSLIIVMTVLGF